MGWSFVGSREPTNVFFLFSFLCCLIFLYVLKFFLTIYIVGKGIFFLMAEDQTSTVAIILACGSLATAVFTVIRYSRCWGAVIETRSITRAISSTNPRVEKEKQKESNTVV